MLDVTRLRVLVAVARHGSVTAAAHALNYAQPSVSHHLARLEAETGTRLVKSGAKPPTFVSPNVGLPADHNQNVYHEYMRFMQKRRG